MRKKKKFGIFKKICEVFLFLVSFVLLPIAIGIKIIRNHYRNQSLFFKNELRDWFLYGLWKQGQPNTKWSHCFLLYMYLVDLDFIQNRMKTISKIKIDVL